MNIFEMPKVMNNFALDMFECLKVDGEAPVFLFYSVENCRIGWRTRVLNFVHEKVSFIHGISCKTIGFFTKSVEVLVPVHNFTIITKFFFSGTNSSICTKFDFLVQKPNFRYKIPLSCTKFLVQNQYQFAFRRWFRTMYGNSIEFRLL